MTSNGFTFVEHVILALLIAILVRMALPTLGPSLSKLRASREHAYVVSMKTDLVQLVMAEEDYFRDSLKYTSAVRCTTPSTRGVLNFCPSRGNVLQGPTINSGDAGLGWWATMTNIALPNVTCAIFANGPAVYPALIEGTPSCRRPGWSGRADDTTGQIK
jgi:hypothetical protein